MFLKKILLLLSCVLFTIISIFAQSDQTNKIIVGTKVAEPFVIKNLNNNWTGLSFELWNRIAKDLGFEYEIREYDLQGLLDAVSINEIDIAVSPLTITSERENVLDFTHSYFTTGLSIAVSNKEDNSILTTAKNIFSTEFIEVVLLLSLTLFVVGFIVWLFERKKNKEQFGDGITKGLGSSFWWAAVTITTVGYGDKSPKTTGGRIVALIWMFAGLIMISGFTAAIASALTVDKLDVGINSLSDLYEVSVGTVIGSSSEEYLNQNGFDFIRLSNFEEGMELLSNNKIDALVYDAPILKYYIKTKNISNKIRVLPIILDPINYAFALPSNSSLRETINRVLLKEIDNADWKKIVNSYLGNR
ncbi:MAG: transporter substrate-binding domain-containing protein [Ignavibacteriales bacterium]|nr:transporter substrate-binding domain-containing protein [Ignavibacteriales bacterium]